MNEKILPRIRGPHEVKHLSRQELQQLAEELRQEIIYRVSRNGGHLASNLGIVELTLALHRVFDSPQDKIIWDVGHQCYPHKLLTGRYRNFSGLRKKEGISGFPKRSESPHDVFETGHASTSISAALGMLVAERSRGSSHRVIAVIGDGALTGGLAYEALSHAGQLQIPLIVVLNDNSMSIGPNVGGISKHLSMLTMKASYQRMRNLIDRCVKKIPLIGQWLYTWIVRFKNAIKILFYPRNFFVDLGFEYVGPIDGHHMLTLEEVFRDIKQLNRPVVVHVVTQKGRGYKLAEKNPAQFHGIGSFSIEDGMVEKTAGFTFTDGFGKAMVTLGEACPSLVAITAAMEKGTGLTPFRERFPERFFDVGIAESHGVTFAAGLAANGLLPVVAIYSSFMQRAVDQVIHDVALQNLPVIFALDRSGVVPEDGETHQGIYDISLFRSVPHMALLAPATAGELEQMLRWALEQRRPVMIRYPKAPCPKEEETCMQPLETGRGAFVRRNGGEVCLAFTGSLLPEALKAAEILDKEGIPLDLYNFRFIKPLDEVHLFSIIKSYRLFIIAEEGVREGGLGEHLVTRLSEIGIETSCKVLGIPEGPLPQGTRQELLSLCGLDGTTLAQHIHDWYGTARELHRKVSGT
ncbi:MAG TPA: 1-deoxy-D-xylulose-5-phosphate synthase [Termitinemataceae bacterium]|nr:1-deoxy-D-xylulose-5-phosphate synthase [Termitinemataceae bacterium]HOM22689.1 1-deoxy-D-xylulose-5-phosphate synthase [Termitinemataceae bacterium]HPP99528.1 1-deoxy-D-xylulose-5-phosphate synthase [Termitinemataceae bacterium]